MTWIKKQFQNLVLILILTIALLELIGFFVFDDRYTWAQRYLSLSSRAVVNEEIYLNGKSIKFWKYRPSSEVRSIAVYTDFLGATIEYDCRFKTNRFGFIDTGVRGGKADFLVLGDSFTEGQGGCPWLTKSTLQSDDELKVLNILNGGLQGAGIQAFEKILKYHEEYFDIKNLIVIAISNDFKRGDVSVVPTETPCYLYLECPDQLIHYVSFDTSDENLKLASKKRREARIRTDVVEEAFRYSFTYYIYERLESIVNPGSKKTESLEVYQDNFSSLQRIRSKYPSMKLILVPQRDEVGLFGRENFDTRTVKSYLRRNGIPFLFCELGGSDYMPKDGHPNKMGYDKIFSCLKQIIITNNMNH